MTIKEIERKISEIFNKPFIYYVDTKDLIKYVLSSNKELSNKIVYDALNKIKTKLKSYPIYEIESWLINNNKEFDFKSNSTIATLMSELLNQKDNCKILFKMKIKNKKYTFYLTV